MKKTLTAEDVVKELKRLQGEQTNAAFAERLGVTKAYLGDIYMNRRTPGPAVLSHLGIVKEVIYRRVA